MAEMLVDGAKLDACNTAEADAIRAKTGGTSPIPYDYANNKGFADAIAAIPSGGGAEYRIELSDFVDGTPTTWTLYGAIIPNQLLYYFNYYPASAAKAVTVKFTKENVSIGTQFVSNAAVKYDFSDAENIEYIGDSGLASRWQANVNGSDIVVSLPKYGGYRPGGSTETSNLFRGSLNQYAPKVYRLPSMVRIPVYAWYQSAITGMDVVIGSIGKGVTSCGLQPFGASTNATGTVTIYTTGSVLDTIKTAVQNNAGSGLQFIYKAAEATEYGGVSYAAGDTMLTVGGA